MENKEQKNTQSTNSESKQRINKIKLETKDYEMDLTIRRPGNPAEILKKMYELRENKTLSDEEKNEEVKKILMEYLR